MEIIRLVVSLCICWWATVSEVNGQCSNIASIPLQYLGPLMGQWYLAAESASTQGCQGLLFTDYNYPYVNFTITELFAGSNSIENSVFVSNNTFLITNPDNPTFQPTQGPLVAFTYKIIASDYQSYFLAYSCVGSLGTSYVYTLQNSLTQPEFNYIKQQLKELGLPDNLVNVKPTDCVSSIETS